MLKRCLIHFSIFIPTLANFNGIAWLWSNWLIQIGFCSTFKLERQLRKSSSFRRASMR
jgi:hypothetical protein